MSAVKRLSVFDYNVAFWSFVITVWTRKHGHFRSVGVFIVPKAILLSSLQLVLVPLVAVVNVSWC